MLLLVLTHWEIHSIRDCLSVKSMENQLLSLAFIFPARVWYLPLLSSYLLFWQAAPLQVSRTGKDSALTGTAIFCFMIRLFSLSTYFSSVCLSAHTSVLQAALAWGRHQENRQQRQDHWAIIPRHCCLRCSQDKPSWIAKPLPQSCHSYITWPHLCQQGIQEDEHCNSTEERL